MLESDDSKEFPKIFHQKTSYPHSIQQSGDDTKIFDFLRLFDNMIMKK